jgi:hypothetical protein
LNVFDFKSLPDKLINVLLHEIILDLMSNLAEETVFLICVKIIANDPVCLYAQQGKIAFLIDLDWSALVYYRIAHLLAS